MIIGTLYMASRPVQISDNITEYIPKAKLELRPALNDLDYQVRAIRVSDAYIADRVLLNKISYDQILEFIQ